MTKTKGEILIFLKKNNFNVPKTILFSVNQLKENKLNCIKYIQKNIKKKLAIRSSAFNEDTKLSSNAGKYTSVLNIDVKNQSKIYEAIKKVRSSYDNQSNKNQIIFQEMVSDVKFSGVLTNVDLKNYSPHIKINYTYKIDTSLITSGKEKGTTISYFANSKYKPKDKIISNLISLQKKLKAILKIKYLDVEFAVNKKNEIIILQARRIVIPKRVKLKKFDILSRSYKNLEKKIIKLQNKHYDLKGDKNFFGVMPDWNPAEMLGFKPKPLALSLYQELITDHIWSKNRMDYGFADMTSYHLMTVFFGTPFIDIRTDFNSWLPANLDNKLSSKLVNFYLNKFEKNKDLHDKIEFKLIYSCFTFSTNNKLFRDFKNKNFSKKEISKFSNSLKKISHIAFKNLDNEIKKIELLKDKQLKVSNSKMYEIQKIYYLVEDCKKFGTLPFAGLARSAFCAIDILNSMVEKLIISELEKEKFLSSIKGLTSEMNLDLFKLKKKEFQKKYGHLRPNTYEINSLNYKDGYSLYFDKKEKNIKNSKSQFRISLSKDKKRKIIHYLNSVNLNIKIDDFFNLLKKAIYYREYSKFIFTKSIDLIFENIKSFAKNKKITQNDLSYLEINDFLSAFYSIDVEKFTDKLKRSIYINKKKYLKNMDIIVPSVILSPKDLFFFEDNLLKGNFITNNIISGKSQFYSSLSDLKKLSNKIVLIENADPGYDFIFSKNIKGFITKFGGQNSHMSIRAAELRMPASIGVGHELFEKLKEKNYITIDCKNEKIF